MLKHELGRDYDGNPAKGVGPDLVGWYRNPSAASKDSLRIAYRDGDAWKSCQPDFIFIHRDSSGMLRPSILDPHGTHLADALPKLRATVDYAENHGDRFLRIDSMAAIEQKKGEEPALLVLDMLDPAVRAKVRAARANEESARALFKDAGQPYKL